MALDTAASTRQPSQVHRLDEPRLLSYLRQQLKLPAGNLSSKQFQHGQSNPTYLLEVGGQRLVLRKQPPGKLLASAHAVDREYRVLTALSQAGERASANDKE
jgi:aminoglycoside phosphotransferase (APT) family kinase protein